MSCGVPHLGEARNDVLLIRTLGGHLSRALRSGRACPRALPPAPSPGRPIDILASGVAVQLTTGRGRKQDVVWERRHSSGKAVIAERCFSDESGRCHAFPSSWVASVPAEASVAQRSMRSATTRENLPTVVELRAAHHCCARRPACRRPSSAADSVLVAILVILVVLFAGAVHRIRR
jgi:hypothetical protein